jgi:hypothetical protein
MTYFTLVQFLPKTSGNIEKKTLNKLPSFYHSSRSSSHNDDYAAIAIESSMKIETYRTA